LAERSPDCGDRAQECSTPFGIEEVGGIWTNRANRPTRVLNAFRHRRGWRLIQRQHHRAAGLVLNAFRHRRGWRSADMLDAHGRQRCSTPFGIEEVGGPASAMPAQPPASVLNAFRHRRGWRVHDRTSRPPGPRVLNAFRHRRGWRDGRGVLCHCEGNGAQRLSASKRLAVCRD